MKSLAMVLIFISNLVYSADEFSFLINEIIKGPSLKQTNNCSVSIPQKDNFDCSIALSQYKILRAQLWDIYKNPEKYGFSEADQFSNKFHMYTSEYEKELVSLGNQCLESKYRTCSQNLNSDISLQDLNSIFNEAKTSRQLRMIGPGAACHIRAKFLADKLLRLGYKSEIIHIKSAPTLIAPLIDQDDKYKNKFIDYNGQHYVVSVRGEDNQEYILDPQFSEKPLLKNNYFKLTTGSICDESATPKSIWSCNYSKFSSAKELMYGQLFRTPRNQERYKDRGDSIEDIMSGKIKTNCGIINDKWLVDMPQKSNIYKDGKKISDTIRKQLIIATLEKKFETSNILINDPLEFENEASLKDYKRQLEKFPKAIKRICRNLELSNKSCLNYRANYKKILLEHKVQN